MSTGNFDGPPLNGRNLLRRPPPEDVHYGYEMPPTFPAHRRSPEPGPSSRRFPLYDSSLPPRPAFSDHPRDYRENSWHAGPAYYDRPPSPDRYESRRRPDTESWGRSPSWDASAYPSLHNRRPLAPRLSPHPESSHRETIAERMFEPSDAWKSSHRERSYRPEPVSPSGRYSDSRWESRPERTTRAYSPASHTANGDLYRPEYVELPVYRDSHFHRLDFYSPGTSYDRAAAWSPRQLHESPSSARICQTDTELVHSKPKSESPGPYHHGYDSRSHGGMASNLSPPPYHPHSPHPQSGRSQTSNGISTGLSYAPGSSIHNSPIDQSPRAPVFQEGPTKKRFRSGSPEQFSRGFKHTRFTQDNINGDEHESQTEVTFIKGEEWTDSVSIPPRPSISIACAATDGADHSTGLVKSGPLNDGSLGLHAEHVSQSTTEIQTTQLSPSLSSTPERSLDIPGRASSIASSIQTPADETASSQDKVVAPIVGGDSPPLVDLNLSSLSTHHSENPVPGSPFLTQKSAMVFPPSCDVPSPDEFWESDNNGLLSQRRLSPSQTDVDSREVNLSGNLSTLAPQVNLETTQPLAPSQQVTEKSGLPEGQSRCPDDIVEGPDAKTIADALRIVVKTRLQCDDQSVDQRINPVLMANLAIADTSCRPSATINDLVRESSCGDCLNGRLSKFEAARPALVKDFSDRQQALEEKRKNLREEYLSLHERWLVHCSKLEDSTKVGNNQDEGIPPSGRTTRRSSAVQGDAVRSDLEMEQIIASLGIDELTDPSHLAIRNVATIPDMISVTRGQVDYLFDDTNNLVDDPDLFYESRTGIEDWTEEEKEIFLEKFAAYPKQFGLIAEHLPHKTASQCVTYYYLHKKKFIDFRKVVQRYAPGKRRRGGKRTDKQKGNALLTDIRKHDDEVSKSAKSSGLVTRRKKTAHPSDAKKPVSSRRPTFQFEPTPASTPTPDPEPEVRPRRRRVRVSTSQEGEEDATDVEPKAAKKSRRNRKTKPPSFARAAAPRPPTVTDPKVPETPGMVTSRRESAVSTQWIESDINIFITLVAQHGDDFKRIAASMPNKTTIQVSNFYKANSDKYQLTNLAALAPKRSATPEAADNIWQEVPNFTGCGVLHVSSIPGTPIDGQ